MESELMCIHIVSVVKILLCILGVNADGNFVQYACQC